MNGTYATASASFPYSQSVSFYFSYPLSLFSPVLLFPVFLSSISHFSPLLNTNLHSILIFPLQQQILLHSVLAQPPSSVCLNLLISRSLWVERVVLLHHVASSGRAAAGRCLAARGQCAAPPPVHCWAREVACPHCSCPAAPRVAAPAAGEPTDAPRHSA